MSDANIWNAARHMRSGECEPARWNELCLARSSWRAYPSTAALTSNPELVRCMSCIAIMEDIPVDRRWWSND